MKLAKKAFVIALTMLTLVFALSAQTLRSDKDPRNIAPTVGTGGPPGGPTGLFTVYDGQTLRRGEFTFSAAYSNFDRDPGNADFTEVPVSFQFGLNDYLELWFNTDAYRAVKVNSPRNLSGFYLPNSGLNINGVVTRPPAIILAPRGPGTPVFQGAIYRPAGAPFAQYPFDGGSVGNLGLTFPFFSGPLFGFGVGTQATIGGPRDGGGSGADLFPGVGSIYGSILPGVVLSTATLTGGNCATTAGAAAGACQAPTVFTVAPTYLPDAPFINRQYGESSFSTFTVGAKWRMTGPNNPIGFGLIPFYRFYADKADNFSGFNQLQRGASPGASRGDVGLVVFADARLRKWINVSANVGYIYNSSVKGEFFGGTFTILDRPDEFMSAVAVDFPVNKYFQPIAEFRSTMYVGGRTPNAFENSPLDGLAGVRIFPTRWMSIGGAYRYNFNQQDRASFGTGTTTTGTVLIAGAIPQTITSSFTGVPNGFNPSNDPHGFMFQITAGRRNERQKEIINPPANVNSVTLGERRVTVPCPPGFRPKPGANCSDDMSVSVATSASDPDNDVLTYNYTVSGGRIVGQGANVSWDLTGANPGTYTVTVGVDDGCGVCGTTKTETITVAACDCEPIPVECSCPSLSVSGPTGDTPAGGTMTFSANVSGGTATNVTYNWTVSAGEIVSGQGTPVITVQAPAQGPANVTATVEIGGSELCPSCQRTASETAGVPAPLQASEVDNFGPLSNDDVKARIEAFYRNLSNDPNATGYIINYGTAKEIANRENQINKAITFLRLDKSRVTMVRGGANPNGTGVYTRLFVVPAGASNPTP